MRNVEFLLVMTRRRFLWQLRQGLRGLEQQEVERILADYDAHFAEGLALGRGEADVASALGDPISLAREFCPPAAYRPVPF